MFIVCYSNVHWYHDNKNITDIEDSGAVQPVQLDIVSAESAHHEVGAIKEPSLLSRNPESESGTCVDAKLADLDIPETITEYIGQSDDQKAISVTTDFRVNGSALEVKVSLPLPTYMVSKITDKNTRTKKTEGTEIQSSKDSGVSSSSGTITQPSCHHSHDPVIEIFISKSTGQSELVKTTEIHLQPDLKWSDLKITENQTSVPGKG